MVFFYSQVLLDIQEAIINLADVMADLWPEDNTPRIIQRVLVHYNYGAAMKGSEADRCRFILDYCDSLLRDNACRALVMDPPPCPSGAPKRSGGTWLRGARWVTPHLPAPAAMVLGSRIRRARAGLATRPVPQPDPVTEPEIPSRGEWLDTLLAAPDSPFVSTTTRRRAVPGDRPRVAAATTGAEASLRTLVTFSTPAPGNGVWRYTAGTATTSGNRRSRAAITEQSSVEEAT